MEYKESILDCIGKTPIIKLNKVVPSGCSEVYLKAEFLNPGGSIKDRMVKYVLENAMRDGDVNGSVVENSSGNTGFALAMLSAVYGLDCTITIPDKMSSEKVNMLRGMGAKVLVTPTNVPADSPDSYYETAKRIHRENPGSYYLNQYHNVQNIEAHYHTTGKEIWDQTQGEIDCLVAGLGTGGTMSGVSKYLKERRKDTLTVGVDPYGSVYKDFHETGVILVTPILIVCET